MIIHSSTINLRKNKNNERSNDGALLHGTPPRNGGDCAGQLTRHSFDHLTRQQRGKKFIQETCTCKLNFKY